MDKEQRALEIVLHVPNDGPEKRLKNGPLAPRDGPPDGTTVCLLLWPEVRRGRAPAPC